MTYGFKMANNVTDLRVTGTKWCIVIVLKVYSFTYNVDN